jgi:hypothetical protein
MGKPPEKRFLEYREEGKEQNRIKMDRGEIVWRTGGW